MESRPSSRIAYLDGLRALAVLSVVGSHAILAGHLSTIHSYFLTDRILFEGRHGVGLFFVISGYINAYLLLRSPAENPGRALLAFYVRRTFKLVPPMLIVVATTAVANWYYRVSSCRAIDYVSALTFTKEFFVDPNHVSGCLTLNHFWSLSVFYLAWAPLIFFGSRRLRLRIFFPLLAFAAIITLLQRFTTLRIPTIVHLPELVLGALIAEAHLRGELERFRRLNFAVTAFFVTFALLCANCAINFYRGSYAIFAIFGLPILGLVSAATMLYGLFHPHRFVAKVVASRPLVLVGLCSYSIYLWQQSLILFTTPQGRFPWQTWYGSGAACFVVGYLSYRYIETPCQRVGKKISAQLIRTPAKGIPLKEAA